MRSRIFIVIAALALAAVLYGWLSTRQRVDYITDVKPIINKKCISCHGGVKAKAGFSLLFREEALAPTESGKPAIVPCNAAASEMIRRLTASDPEERMPYKHEPLSKEEISILKRWINQGANWGTHWAYLPLEKTAVPSLSSPFVKNDIDAFVLEKLQEQKLQPSPQADKASLLRRVSLDLTGMHPSEKVANAFLSSADSNKAYEVLVDSLLASPAFGERWASMWLDVARYADSKGYESDVGRSIWRYRDWVIRAFNSDMPYNRFITEQMAGDMLPDAGESQYLATAFHRNSMTNDEGGTSNEEFRVAAVIDRVNTSWEGLMGTTFACVQCHSHPYDPFKHEEYYRFMAYLNNTRDEDVPMDYPLYKHFADSTHLQAQLTNLVGWLKQTAGPAKADELQKFILTEQPAIYSATADALQNSAVGNKNYALFLRNNALARFNKVDLQGTDQLIVQYNTSENGGTLQIHLDSANGPLLAAWPAKATKGFENVAVPYAPQQGRHDIYISYTNPGLGKKGETFVLFFNWLHVGNRFPGEQAPGYAEQKKVFFDLLSKPVPTTPVLVENPDGMQRTQHVFVRGAWTVHGKQVEPGVPALLAFAMPKQAPKNRLGVAMWLTDTRHPLVSRALVNRMWEQLFGTGIAETLEDLGTQGLPPTHKELLDYLSYTFMHDMQWSTKKLLKTMVMSSTYRQDSKMTEEGRNKDLFNRYYSRGPRVRLSAEQLRDQALCISGQLNNTLYGAPVMPWQPQGIWLSPYNGAQWQNSTGASQYRRALYTYWKRTAPYPSMIGFDAAQRMVCAARRIRTNTPLQALVTLNDSAYFDLARHFAYRMQKQAAGDAAKQISAGYSMMLFKSMPVAKLKVMMNLYNKALDAYRKKPEDIAKLCATEEEAAEKPTAETAALIVVANAMMNLDEMIMK